MTTALQAYFQSLLRDDGVQGGRGKGHGHGGKPIIVADSAKMLPRSKSFTVSSSSNGDLRKIVHRTNSDSQTGRTYRGKSKAMTDDTKKSLLNSKWDASPINEATAVVPNKNDDRGVSQHVYSTEIATAVTYGRKMLLQDDDGRIIDRTTIKKRTSRFKDDCCKSQSPTTKKHLRLLPDLFSPTSVQLDVIESEFLNEDVVPSKPRGTLVANLADTTTAALSQAWWNHLEGVLDENIQSYDDDNDDGRPRKLMTLAEDDHI